MSRLRRAATIFALAMPLPIAALPLAAILVFSAPASDPGEPIMVTELRAEATSGADVALQATFGIPDAGAAVQAKFDPGTERETQANLVTDDFGTDCLAGGPEPPVT